LCTTPIGEPPNNEPPIGDPPSSELSTEEAATVEPPAGEERCSDERYTVQCTMAKDHDGSHQHAPDNGVVLSWKRDPT
jgi:hypothetical protein